jgi:cobalamin biosynthesis Co2+ chelatase CbiK
MKNISKNIFIHVSIFCVLVLAACGTHSDETTSKVASNKKIGILFVNHGSRSGTWRQALLDLETNVKDSILKNQSIKGTKTAFMEYTEPSIATRLKEFDKEGYTDIIIVPIFLTVSTHSFDDIPTISGQKEDPQSVETLKTEKIECYKPKANVHIAPLLDFTDVLQKNVLRRVQELSKNAKDEGLVLIAYGDQTYNKEWTELLTNVGNYVTKNTGMTDFSFGWCGHIANYNPDSTTIAINKVLKKKKMATVIPVLVAIDDNFQVRIIGDGINKIKGSKEKVLYNADAILPDKNIENWVIQISNEYANKLINPVAEK